MQHLNVDIIADALNGIVQSFDDFFKVMENLRSIFDKIAGLIEQCRFMHRFDKIDNSGSQRDQESFIPLANSSNVLSRPFWTPKHFAR